MPKASPKRVPGFVFRSGYVVPFTEGDVAGMIDHLKNAILGESLARLKTKRKKTLKAVANEIAQLGVVRPMHLAIPWHQSAQGFRRSRDGRQ